MHDLAQKRKFKRGGKLTRNGATAVEFAVVSPIFFLSLFACFEFGKLSMVESFAEDAAFRAARHGVVLGATVEESFEIAVDTLAIVGVRNALVTIEPSFQGVVQYEIDDSTDTISVEISIPMGDNLIAANFLDGYVMEKKAVLFTERFRDSVN